MHPERDGNTEYVNDSTSSVKETDRPNALNLMDYYV